MDLEAVPTDSGNEKQHRSIIATLLNKLAKVRQPNDLTQAEVSAGIKTVDARYPPYYVLRYFADPTGARSSLDAFTNAVRAAEAGNNNTVWAHDGTYLLDGEVLIHQGVKIRGFGSSGSTEGGGFFIKHAANGNCFKWDGNGISARGTGGGLYHCTIVKQSGFSGGHAIEVLATDDSHRPTEFVFHDVLIYGTGTGEWARGFVIDGTACDTPGGKGVRDIGIFKMRVATCSTDNEYVKIAQGVHVNGSYLQIDTGGGSGVAGMTISDDSGPINISALEINGTLIIGDNADEINLQGHVGSTLTQASNTSCFGSFCGSVGSTIDTVSKSFKVVSSHADAFQARVGTTVANATGDGTAYTIICDTETFDKNGAHSTSTGIATLKTAGLYTVSAGVLLNSVGAAHTDAVLELVQKTSGGSTVIVHTVKTNPGAVRNVGNQVSLNLSAIIDASNDDTIELHITVSGSTKTVGVVGASTAFTYFSAAYTA